MGFLSWFLNFVLNFVGFGGYLNIVIRDSFFVGGIGLEFFRFLLYDKEFEFRYFISYLFYVLFMDF